MPAQQTPDRIEKMPFMKGPVKRNSAWIDVSEIARGVGFTEMVQVCAALIDQLTPLQSEVDNSYEQRLYDALRRAHLELAQAHTTSPTFSFSFAQRFGQADEMQVIRVYLHAETGDKTVYLGRAEDFWQTGRGAAE